MNNLIFSDEISELPLTDFLLKSKKPIVLNVYSYKSYFKVECKEYDIHFIILELSNLQKEFIDWFEFLWRNYAKCSNKKLSKSGRILKKKLIDNFEIIPLG